MCPQIAIIPIQHADTKVSAGDFYKHFKRDDNEKTVSRVEHAGQRNRKCRQFLSSVRLWTIPVSKYVIIHDAHLLRR